MNINVIKKKMIQTFNKDFVWLFLLNAGLMVFLFCFSGENYSCDGYGILVNGPEYHIKTFIGSYRFFGGFVYYILSLTKHIPVYNSFIDVLFFVLLTSWIVTCLVFELNKQFRFCSVINKLIIDIAVVISVINVWFCNILSFPECIIITAIGLFCCFLSIILIEKWKSWYIVLLSSVLLMCATAVYQQFLFMFVIYILAFFIIKIMTMKALNFKDVFWAEIKRIFVILLSVFLYIIGALVSVSVFKLSGSNRVAFSIESIIEKIMFFIEKQKLYLSGRGFFDTKIMLYCFMLLFIITFCAIMIQVIKHKDYIRALFILCVFVASYFVAYVPGIISDGDGFRQLFALYTMFLVSAVIVLSNFKNKKVLCVYLIFLIGVLSVNSIQIIESEFKLKKINAADSFWGDMVLYEIEEYETESGITIDSISFCEDAMPSGNSIKSSYSESVLTVDWSRGYFIQFKSSKREFKEVDMPEDVYMTYFAGKNWDSFNRKEQIVFVDNTAYICCY